MTTPAGPILGAVHLDDGVNSKFDWQRAAGLSDANTVLSGSIQATFDGPFRVLPRRQTRAQRDVLLTGYLTHSGGTAEGWSRLLSVQQLVATPLAVLQVGRLGLDVVPATIKPERLKAMKGAVLDYTTTITSVPGTWRALYGVNSGSTYGITANAESLANTTTFQLAASASPLVINAGTAPTPLVLTISVSGRTTRFYVRSTAPGYAKRISITPQVNGVATITEDMGLFVPPGSSTLRYEEASGALITGTIASSIYGTRWRWDGLPTAEATANPVIIYNTRQQRAYAATAAFGTNSGLTLYQPDVPRFGNSGTFSSTTAGLVVEPDRTNLVLQSETLATAPWATAGMVTVTNNVFGNPVGAASAATQVQFAGAMAGSVSQSVTLTAAPYVVSFYAKWGGSSGTNFRVSMGGILAATQIVTTANWQRFQFLVTGTAAAYSLSFSDDALAAANVSIWGVQVELATGQTAANATSYIPTTSTTQRRFADVIGVRRLENQLAWSNRFDKSTASSTTRGLWYLAGGTLTTATMQTGPSGVTDAATLTTVAAGGVPGIQQRILNAEHLSGKTVSFSVWMRNASATPSSNAFIRIQEFGGTPGSTDNAVSNLDDKWQRVIVQRKLSAGVTDVSVQIRTSDPITVYFAHAQAFVASDGDYNLVSLSNGSDSCPYVETQGTPYLAQGTWVWPEWLTQNGYLEADICLSETSTPNSVGRAILGADANGLLTPLMHQGFIRRSSTSGSADFLIGCGKQNDAGTTAANYTPTSSLYDGTYHKYRMEWVNYTIGSTRTIRLQFYVDGLLVASGTTGGATRWLRPPVLEVVSGSNGSLGAFQTMKNIVIGSPVLPANALPQPY